MVQPAVRLQSIILENPALPDPPKKVVSWVIQLEAVATNSPYKAPASVRQKAMASEFTRPIGRCSKLANCDRQQSDQKKAFLKVSFGSVSAGRDRQKSANSGRLGLSLDWLRLRS